MQFSNDQIKEPMLHLHTLIYLINAQDGINEASLIKKFPPARLIFKVKSASKGAKKSEINRRGSVFIR